MITKYSWKGKTGSLGHFSFLVRFVRVFVLCCVLLTLGAIIRAETWILALGGYGATVPDKLCGAFGLLDENYIITIKLITIKLYF